MLVTRNDLWGSTPNQTEKTEQKGECHVYWWKSGLFELIFDLIFITLIWKGGTDR